MPGLTFIKILGNLKFFSHGLKGNARLCRRPGAGELHQECPAVRRVDGQQGEAPGRRREGRLTMLQEVAGQGHGARSAVVPRVRRVPRPHGAADAEHSRSAHHVPLGDDDGDLRRAPSQRRMDDALDGDLKKKDKTKQYEALHDGIATVLALAFLLWLVQQQVMLVMGKGPIPTFAPPFVPVGPVVMGDNLPIPGHLMA
jgi:hypothetical protein